jgi:predicted ABC-class ATPase
MRGDAELAAVLARIDGRGYKAYLDLEGAWQLSGFQLFVDRVQRDPFAAPSRLRARVAMESAALPQELARTRTRRIALQDFLARQLRRASREVAGGGRSGSGGSGLLEIDAGAQEVLERSACVVTADWAEARLELGLPAAGRRVLGREADRLLRRVLPEVVQRALLWEQLPQQELVHFVECVENQEQVRAALDDLGLVAFVGDGALLPRESGASDRPLRRERAVLFAAPPSLSVAIPVPNPVDGGSLREVRGMGIPKGVTLIAGGGYHGKSTLLQAIERGVYPHVPGDGRELVVSAPGLVKIRAEDGRFAAGVDIQAFIGELPGGRRTHAFSTLDASGSTSQAASLVEALEAGASGLLLDEDTCASNFMVRDARMQALVPAAHEPITPFLERVRALWEERGVSSVLVTGGCGDYFDVADRVIAMRDYRACDVTGEARRVATELPSRRRSEATRPLGRAAARIPLAESFDARRGRREVRIDARGRFALRFGTSDVDLRALEQLVDPSQTRAVGLALHLASRRFVDGRATVGELLDRLDAFLDAEGLDPLDPGHRPERHPGRLARPRRFEVAAALNRLRTLRVRQEED